MGVDSITIDGTVPVPARTTACDPIVRKDDAKLAPDTVAYRRRPCVRVANAPNSPRRHQLAAHARKDFEKHIDTGHVARTSPHRTDPCVASWVVTRPGIQTQGAVTGSGIGHVRRAPSRARRDRTNIGHQRQSATPVTTGTGVYFLPWSSPGS
jgi:hypothetical protein